ncbi:hypothetical protein APT_01209 [Acetobacter pasteurianus NBRC 101655]|nr:hypothetical protein APT_01209 [Acetobacter pasteurianus NBRC 101655]
MNCILISCVSAVIISILFALASHGTSGAMEGIKLTDWMQGFGSILAVAIACVAAKWAKDAAQNSDKISIGQNVNEIAKFFSEKINSECPDVDNMAALYNSQEREISNFITSIVKSKEAIENVSTKKNIDQYLKILLVYLDTNAIIELRDGTCFLEALKYYIDKYKDHFYTDGGEYDIWYEIYKQYIDMQKSFKISISPKFIKETKKYFNKDIMLKHFNDIRSKKLSQDKKELGKLINDLKNA